MESRLEKRARIERKDVLGLQRSNQNSVLDLLCFALLAQRERERERANKARQRLGGALLIINVPRGERDPLDSSRQNMGPTGAGIGSRPLDGNRMVDTRKGKPGDSGMRTWHSFIGQFFKCIKYHLE